ncbi:MAG: ribonuclease [Acidobacteriota bacterium]|jgi:ribonuclease Z|nr:ribonuclease [Acidobacteriota bacterium]
MLFDPGEGTQRQMTFANVSASDITKILITHFHGDHCLGLAGIWQRLSLDRVRHAVQLFYPASGQRYVENLKNASIFYNVAEVEEHPISQAGVIYESQDIFIEARLLDHTVESWGYRIQEKDSQTMLPDKLKEFGVSGQNIGRLKKEGSLDLDGRIISLESASIKRRGQSMAFVMDTRLCETAFQLADKVDLLVCESTYLASETEDAVAHGHLTATQAAEIALKAQAELLALTHFSQRYNAVEDFALEAQKIHPKVVAMRDGDVIELPKRK